jgi:ribosome biogenesis GTPase
MMETLPGLIVRCQSGFYTVEIGPDHGPRRLVCRLRGRLKLGRPFGDIAALGDRVRVSEHPDGTGMIEEIVPRERAITRLAPTPRGLYQQVLLANPDQAVFIFACTHPDPRLRMLDRFLVIAEKEGIPAVIVANKVDLVDPDQARGIFGHYVPLGYPVIYTSVRQGTGLEELRQVLSGKLSGFTGPSGVGKSSLLNALQPGLGLAVRDVSESTRKGRHTTNVRQMWRLEMPAGAEALSWAGYVADTPGIRSLALWDTQPEEIDGYFPELRLLVQHCTFNDCTHQNEPGCAVRQAVEQGKIHPERYHSYLRLRFAEEE